MDNLWTPPAPGLQVVRRHPLVAVATPGGYLTKAATVDPDQVQYTYVPVTWHKAASDDGRDTGEVEGYAAIFGNVDLQGDMILKGAFKRTLARWREAKTNIPLVDGHMAADQDRLLGSVVMAREDDVGLKFRAVFSSVQRAQDARTKAIEGHLSGVSIGWLPDPSVPDSISFQEGADGIVRVLKVIRLLEISLTPIPANPEATLTSAKSAIGAHGTATTDAGTWDAGANERRLPNSAAALRAAFAWRDPDGDPDTKAAYRFIHHVVSEDGEVGAAHMTACSTGIGVLNGGRGGTTIPDADRRGVYNHLARHLRDGDREPPELKAAALSYEAFETQLRAALGLTVEAARKAAVDALVDAYHTDGAAPGQAPAEPPPADGAPGPAGPDQPAGPPTPQHKSTTVQDAAAYAASLLDGPSGPPPSGAPGSGPPRAPAEPDPLTALERQRDAERVDDLAAEISQLLEGT